MLWQCWLCDRKGIRPVENWVVGRWCGFVWSNVQTCIWPSWCHCHLLSLASVKSRLVLPFWYRLTWVVPDKGPLNLCVCVCVRACVRAYVRACVCVSSYICFQLIISLSFINSILCFESVYCCSSSSHRKPLDLYSALCMIWWWDMVHPYI